MMRELNLPNQQKVSLVLLRKADSSNETSVVRSQTRLKLIIDKIPHDNLSLRNAFACHRVIIREGRCEEKMDGCHLTF